EAVDAPAYETVAPAYETFEAPPAIAAHVPVEEIAAHEPFVFDPIPTAAAEYVARPTADSVMAPPEPAIEFAFASEPLFAPDPSREIVASAAEADISDQTGHEVDDDEIVIDLTGDIV